MGFSSVDDVTVFSIPGRTLFGLGGGGLYTRSQSLRTPKFGSREAFCTWALTVNRSP